MNRQPHAMTDHELDERLADARRCVWTGPDYSPRVDEHLKGIAMKSQSRFSLSRPAVILIAVGALAGGSLAAVVTRSLLTHRITMVTSDGTRYEGQLTETPDGAAGTFVTDDGTVFSIEMAGQEEQHQVTVDVTSPQGGASTVILDNGMAPTVVTEPGQTARIEITPAGADPGGE